LAHCGCCNLVAWAEGLSSWVCDECGAEYVGAGRQPFRCNAPGCAGAVSGLGTPGS